MIFNQIILENFRQYKGKIIIDFPVNEKKITLLVAKNGVGKTTFLQAFRFCFYGESPNALKLPNAKELLNYSVAGELEEYEKVSLSVNVQFSHGGKEYLAIREVIFRKINGKIERQINMDSDFTLMQSTEYNGFQTIIDGNLKIQEMIPMGLAHIYMFDGERVEKPIESVEFKNDLKESVTGILGLKKLAYAKELLGEQGKISTVLGKTKQKIKPLSNKEEEIMEEEKYRNKRIEKNKEEISSIQNNVIKLSEEIMHAEVAQRKINEIKTLTIQRDTIAREIKYKEDTITMVTNGGNKTASKLLFNLELSKQYQKYISFQNSEENDSKLFEGLHESVVNDVIKKGTCICGRCIGNGSDEMHHLENLSVLPHDNGHYLMQINNTFSSLRETPKLIEKMKQIKMTLIKNSKELRNLKLDYENKIEEIKLKEKEYSVKSLQTNIDHLKKHKVLFESKIGKLSSQINEDEKYLKTFKNKLFEIQQNNQHNSDVHSALNDLEIIKEKISMELNQKQLLAREAIEENMNEVVSNLMEGNLFVRLDEDYQLQVVRNIKLSTVEIVRDETRVLSTGQSVMLYLSFLRALLMTIEQNSEFDNGQNNGVIMDAALSNVDERHISLTSKYILNEFDQLIFLSFKRQLRNELFSGIKDNISKAYELDRDNQGNIEVKELDLNILESYINDGEE